MAKSCHNASTGVTATQAASGQLAPNALNLFRVEFPEQIPTNRRWVPSISGKKSALENRRVPGVTRPVKMATIRLIHDRKSTLELALLRKLRP
ncbi:hypothetical protein [Bradyrhizobium sp. JYMT SZCCT0180]|uniref:hypothetical protein n=1 Tax=Bradyrhizobium sp. JYMT SZCCT0180 TaxID=2807666 RepID=UPI001BA66AB1|nr:hypothetical protein [Bradyrhizobium sp. JYMT SZCCT0180]MBR1213577.1 hypothetical protein [Bradyrhizobium sp. JYMT SZCCT0180]